MSEIDSLQQIEQKNAEYEAKLRAQENLVASPAYQSQLKFIGSMTLDAIILLHSFVDYTSRTGEYSDNLLTMFSTGDLAQSILATADLASKGMINPAKRELRYIMEATVKNLYVDQHAQRSESLLMLTERLAFLETNVNSSIDVRTELKLVALSPDKAKQLIDEIYDVYRECCAYIHVSRKQIEERLNLGKKGRSFGFQTAEELRSITRLMFRVYDIVFTLYFHSDLKTTRNIFILELNNLPKWKFHKGKYVRLVSRFFD